MTLRLVPDQRQPASQLKLSFEFFPPRGERMSRRLWRTIGQLELLQPEFFSVTYGALGSARDSSVDTVLQLHRESAVPTAAHLTCVEASKEEVEAVARHFWNSGLRHIVALRGDARGDGAENRAAVPGHADAAELVAALRRIGDFEISVAAYPETHPRAASAQADIAALKRKLDAGANRAISQYFFDAEVFLRFRDRCAAAGIEQPIVPGILPIHDFEQVSRFSRQCGASLPRHYARHFEGMEGNREAQYHLAIDLALETCERLTGEGVDALHFYTLNHTDLCFAVCRGLGRQVPVTPALEAVA